MDYARLLAALEDLLGQVRVGQLTTVDARGWPRTRWMTPVFLPRLPGRLYALTSPRFSKAAEIAAHPAVSWSFQTRTLDTVMQARGRAELINLPQLKTEVMEAIGPNLQIFWRVNAAPGQLVVVETSLEELSLFLPLKQERFEARASASAGSGES